MINTARFHGSPIPSDNGTKQIIPPTLDFCTSLNNQKNDWHSPQSFPSEEPRQDKNLAITISRFPAKKDGAFSSCSKMKDSLKIRVYEESVGRVSVNRFHRKQEEIAVTAAEPISKLITATLVSHG